MNYYLAEYLNADFDMDNFCLSETNHAKVWNILYFENVFKFLLNNVILLMILLTLNDLFC